jgi:exosortase A-associated hydrolase 2
LRAGCLLAVAAAARLDTGCNFLFWHPAVSGKALLQQFLRLKAAAEMASGGGKAILVGLKQDIDRGQAVHVAGYWIHPDLAAGLEHATLQPPGPVTMRASVNARMVWLEVSAAAEPTLSPAAMMALPKWELAGYAQASAAVHGPAFWQTVEIEDAPQLVDATLALLSSTAPA